MADWRIGEIKQVNGEWYQCIKQPEDFIGKVCKICAFQDTENCDIDECSDSFRSDEQDVIFKKLEKVGEPYKFNGHIFQAYRTCEVPIFTENYVTVRELGNDSKISIEIKQNKEDMEEKNLKPFDLQKAREGKSVCTRNGRKARIICFDLQSIENTPIVAAVQVTDKQEVIANYYENGRQFVDGISDLDLMMLPEKKERWVNVYHNEKGEYWSEQVLFSTKKEAIDFVHDHAQYVTTVKIDWEE